MSSFTAASGEDPRTAVLRELHEETGLAGTLVDDHPALIDVVRHDDDAGNPVQTFGMAFVVVADPATPLARERHWNRIVARRR